MNDWIIVAVAAAIALYVIFVFNRLVRLRTWKFIDDLSRGAVPT